MRTAVKTATAASKAHLRKQAIRSHAIVGQVAETGLLLVCELLGNLVRDTMKFRQCGQRLMIKSSSYK